MKGRYFMFFLSGVEIFFIGCGVVWLQLALVGMAGAGTESSFQFLGVQLPPSPPRASTHNKLTVERKGAYNIGDDSVLAALAADPH